MTVKSVGGSGVQNERNEDASAVHAGSPARGPIAFVTDFGAADFYAGAMKGAILSINPAATIFDITHEISPQDIEAAAFTLLAVYRDYPQGTVFVAVVDPGVGSCRRAIVIETANRFFVGPDNGSFSYVLDREQEFAAFHLNRPAFFRQPVSNTFHGRDVFAPVAAHLSLGRAPQELGEVISDPVRLPSIEPVVTEGGAVLGRVLNVDRFGNLVTTIRPEHLGERSAARFSLRICGRVVSLLRHCYAGEETGEAVFAIWGSAGFLEISANRASACEILGARRGNAVEMIFG